MSTADKTAEKLVQSIRKTKTATAAVDKAPAVAAVSATPPKSAVKKAAPAKPAKPAAPAQTSEPKPETTPSFTRRRVWPD